ncbi:MAG: PorP/SprF family type IX secretion system membrane protein [Bacteroidota bacterium]
MRGKIIRLILLFALISGQYGKAQDPHFSQFFASPLTLNPALTGKFDGLVRVAGNYRNQWPTIFNAFTTGTISADFNILHKKISPVDQFGVGIMGMYDVNGAGIMKNNYLNASIAYHKGLDEAGYHQLGVGLSTSFAQRTLNTEKLVFEDQLTTIGFTGTTAEVIAASPAINLNYFGLNAGLLYTGSTNEYNQFYFGAALYHINRPEKSFAGNLFQARERYTLHGGGYFSVASKTSLFLSGNFQLQNAATEMIAGAALGWMINDREDAPTDVYAGGWYRLGDAVIPYVGLENKGFRVGLSYDINVSGLSLASRRQGGFELSLIYIQPNRDGKKAEWRCPRF